MSNPVLGSMGVKTGGSLDDQLSPQVGHRPAALSAASNGLEINKKGYGAALITLVTGAVTGAPTAVDVDIKVQSASAEGGSYSDVSSDTQREGAAVSANIPDGAADSEVSFLLDLGGVENDWIRVVVTPNFTGGTAPTILSAAVVELGAKTSAQDISTSADLY